VEIGSLVSWQLAHAGMFDHLTVTFDRMTLIFAKLNPSVEIPGSNY
jgi:hypothetical protein